MSYVEFGSSEFANSNIPAPGDVNQRYEVCDTNRGQPNGSVLKDQVPRIAVGHGSGAVVPFSINQCIREAFTGELG